ncbi:hypothetical protein [Corynebacterium pacaense]|uniref:hypothetical protein n=1 Tax=Corynebacterium pacaense TaxID=1816684 RepID=UPI0011776C02|nr:hypothetical protein [Corynebacterium pacaense]
MSDGEIYDDVFDPDDALENDGPVRQQLVADQIRPAKAEWSLETADGPDETGFSSWLNIEIDCEPVVVASDEADYAPEADEDNYGDDDEDEEFGETLTISAETIPGTATDWRELSGHHLVSSSFGEPGEAVVVYGDHYRFDQVTIDVIEQRDRTADFAITLSGDLDGLGIDEISFNVSGEYIPTP